MSKQQKPTSIASQEKPLEEKKAKDSPVHSQNINLDVAQLVRGISAVVRSIRSYATFAVFLFFALIYGFMIFQISVLGNPQIDEDAVLKEAHGIAGPKVDDNAAEQLQNLKDNSVNVQALFNQSRTNPFQE